MDASFPVINIIVEIDIDMWFHHNRLTLAIVLAVGQAVAVTQISDDNMNQLLDDGGVELADRYAPIWFFAQSQDQPPCIPDWAFGGSPDSDDTYDDDHKTKPAPQCSLLCCL